METSKIIQFISTYLDTRFNTGAPYIFPEEIPDYSSIDFLHLKLRYTKALTALTPSFSGPLILKSDYCIPASRAVFVPIVIIITINLRKHGSLNLAAAHDVDDPSIIAKAAKTDQHTMSMKGGFVSFSAFRVKGNLNSVSHKNTVFLW